MKSYKLLILVFFWGSIHAQNAFRTEVFNPQIKTFQAGIQNERFVLPIIDLNGSQVLQFSFDEMSHEAHSYSFRVLHCNADWTLSSLTSNEYLAGYTTSNITDFQLSVSTTHLYTHYKFTLPNEDMRFKISGNYVVQIVEDNRWDKPIAQACFSVVEPKVGIQAVVRGNTDVELNRRMQQLDFEVALNGYQVRDAQSEIKVVVRQNNRLDNEVSAIAPTFLSTSKLSYVNNKALIFEGGNEYHRFDISSVYAAGEGVAHVEYRSPGYEVFLYENKIQTSRTYMNNFDVNGKYLINFQDKMYDENTEADYMKVHVVLDAKNPFLDGMLYLGGEFNHNLMDENSMMNYDGNTGKYFKTLLLKQGGYNYQYWFVPKGQKKATVERVDGSYWQTGNEYTIYVYSRPWGERYDRLIGVKSIE